MSKNAIGALVSLFIVVVAGLFAVTYVYKQNQVPAEPNKPTPALPNRYNITRIDGTHFYIDGVHTVVGELVLPTPCDLLTSEASVAESYPEQISLRFNVVNTTDSCEQVVTTQRFKVSATASDQASFNALFMDTPVSLNLVEAKPGETPEDFELFIKG